MEYVNRRETDKNYMEVDPFLPVMSTSFKHRKLERRTGIIHALDEEKLERAKEIAVQVAPYVDAIKLSWPLVMTYGIGTVIGEIRPVIDKPIIACFKVADIPYISSRITDIATRSGCEGITMHGIFGRDTMRDCIEVAHKNGAQTWIVVEMSHHGAEEFTQDKGESIAKMARELGSDGIVAPATRPNRTRRYREIVGDEIKIMSPGIGEQGGRIGDAITAGADYEIIGRRIWNTPDPGAEAKKYAEELAKVLKKRPLVEA